MNDASPAAPPSSVKPPPSMAGFLAQAATLLPPEAVITDPLRRLVYGTDASLYRLIPQAVLRPVGESQVAALLRAARQHRVPLTFRAAGTSLSGQAVTDSVLVQIGAGWRDWTVAPDGDRITLGPAMVGAQANRLLAPYGRRLGPDPASLDSAQIGGIAANNASGMCCGTAENTYRTLVDMRVILADGTTLDTGDAASRTAFAGSHAALLDGLAALAREVRADAALAARIRRKFSIKNTCGYSLNALVDFDDPIDILQHLMVGSEGTLGFIASITYRTVEEPAHKATALIVFSDVRAACERVAALKGGPVDAVELMDRAALRAVEDRPGIPPELAALPEAAAALLIETRAASRDALEARVTEIESILSAALGIGEVAFTEDPQRRAALWAVRKGTLPSVGAVRAAGSTVIIEDVAVETDRLADATLDLRDLFTRHGYDDAIIFGHALAGNLHFVIAPDFAKPGEVARYAAFMDDLAVLIVERHDGSLKAEHGTGRNMAPYVEMEWGAEAYALMWRIKRLFDPAGILNPGVILNDDPQIHVSNIKPMHPADPQIDTCMECGFCEPVCPSRALTLTPRQRIVGLREIARLRASGEDPGRLAVIEASYGYQAIDTCAVDSLCAKACPVGIDTGAMIKTLRADRWGRVGPRVARAVGRQFAAVTWATRWSLGAVDLVHRLLGTRLLSGLTGAVRRVSGNRIPLWTAAMPGASRVSPPLRPATGSRPRVVYFPSCASRAMGPARHDRERAPLSAVVLSLLDKAGYEVVYPDRLGALCCGQPFESKGLTAEAANKVEELERQLLAASRDGRDPVVFDTSPCAFRAMTRRTTDQRASALVVHDLPDFLHSHVLPRLDIARREAVVAVHPTCSTLKRGAEDALLAVAGACARRVVHPAEIHCCGWSGDRGFTYPELNASALGGLASNLPDDCTEGFSSSRTCEIGLSHHSGRPYRSIAYLLDRCAVAKESAKEV